MSSCERIILYVEENNEDVILEVSSLYPVVISKTGSGSVYPSVGTYYHEIDDVIPIYADADGGAPFVDWVINGVSNLSALTYLTVTGAITAIGNFSTSILRTLTMSRTGDGNITPSTGVYTKTNNEVTTLTAVPLNDSYFENWDVNNGTLVSTNPYNITSDADKNVVGIFKTWNNLLEVFGIAPVNIGDVWGFLSLWKGHFIQVKNSRVGKFSISTYINSSKYITGGRPIDLEIDFYYDGLNQNGIRMLFQAGAAGGKGFLVLILNVTNMLQFRNYNGASTLTWQITPLYYVGWYKHKITWNGLTGGVVTSYLYYYNTLIHTATNNGTFAWLDDSSEVLKVSSQTNYYNTFIQRVKLVNYIDWVFNHGQGTVIHDISGNGNNGTVTGAVLSTFWGSTADIEPYSLTLGATLYRNNSDNTIMPICYNKPEEITGYTRLGWFPAGSGILADLSMTYNMPTDADLQAAGIPAGDLNESQIRALTTTDYLLKTEPNAIQITMFKARKK